MCERFAQVWDEGLGRFVQRLGSSMDEAVAVARKRDPGKDYNVAPADSIGVLVRREEVALEWMWWGLPESVAELPLEAVLGSRALSRRRAAVPMTGFYEWRSRDRQPFFFHRRGAAPLLAAAVYGVQRVQRRRAHWAAFLTGPATREVADVRGRLPLVMEPHDLRTWLDSGAAPEDVVDLVSPPKPGTLLPYTVTRAVGSLKTRGPGLTHPQGEPPT